MIPIIKAISFAFSAINAVSTVKTLAAGARSAAAPAAAAADATATPYAAAAATANAATATAAIAAPSKEKTMSTVQDTTAAGASAAAAATGATSTGDMQDRFLKLLVTQLKNQDPLNPLDNAQVTSQMAQISSVTGIEKLNATLQNMSTSFLAGQSLQSAALIGRQVLTGGNSIRFAGTPVAGGAELTQPADRATVTIKGAAGNVVRRIELGPQAAGTARFEWDGKDDAGARAADGAYTFEVAAVRGGQQIAATPLSIGRVNSVSFGNEGLRVDVDGVGAIQLYQIKRIL